MPDIQLTRAPVVGGEGILTSAALDFVADLQLRFGERRDELLAARRRRREDISRSGTLDFLPETAAVRDGDWVVAPALGGTAGSRRVVGHASPHL